MGTRRHSEFEMCCTCRRHAGFSYADGRARACQRPRPPGKGTASCRQQPWHPSRAISLGHQSLVHGSPVRSETVTTRAIRRWRGETARPNGKSLLISPGPVQRSMDTESPVANPQGVTDGWMVFWGLRTYANAQAIANWSCRQDGMV